MLRRQRLWNNDEAAGAALSRKMRPCGMLTGRPVVGDEDVGFLIVAGLFWRGRTYHACCESEVSGKAGTVVSAVES